MNVFLRKQFALVGISITFIFLIFGLSSCASSSPKSELMPCPAVSQWPVKPLTPEMLDALTKYYAEQKLTPISVPKNEVMVLDLKEQSAGEHTCLNSDGGTGAYVGSVPLNATSAIMAYVKHKPYPGTGAPANFVTLALMPDSGWTVVSEGTGP